MEQSNQLLNGPATKNAQGELYRPPSQWHSSQDLV